MMPDSQNAAILEHLKSGGTLTNRVASITFGCERLGARIYELRGLGYDIKTRMITTKRRKRIALYYMESALGTTN